MGSIDSRKKYQQYGRTHGRECDREKGSITVFFLLFVMIVAGAMTYSLYFGRTVEQKMRVLATADIAALSMASHASQGLNMMSTNNLGIGASLHIAASFPIIARYIAIGKALAIDVTDFNDVWIELTTKPDDSTFASAFNAIAPVSGHYVKTAAGLTRFNEKLAKYWLYGALPKGIEQYRLNMPGSIGVPMRTLHPIGSTLSPTTFFGYQYEALKRTSPENAMCHAIKTSESIGGKRNLASAWLRGPIESLTGNMGILNAVERLEKATRAVAHAINTALLPAKLFAKAAKIATAPACAVPIFRPGFCSVIDDVLDAIEAMTEIPIPEFQGCGLNHQGDYSAQVGNFSQLIDINEDHKFGFLYIDAQTAADVEQFNKGVTFAVLLGAPELLSSDLPTEQRNGRAFSQCPDAWVYEFDGQKTCSVLLGGADFERRSSNSSNRDADIANGSVSQALLDASIWKRTTWGIGQAVARYAPAGGDPRFADSRLFPETSAPHINSKKMQLFWPAWAAQVVQPTVTQHVFSFLGTRQ